jgi:putative membrane protein
MKTSHFLLSAWTLSPIALLLGIGAIGWYLRIFPLRRRAGWFVAGIVVLLLTLMSPLNTLADGYLFSAHMAQHILLLLVVPALWLLGLPRVSWQRRQWPILANPVTGWIGGVGAMWFWHVPAMCNAAVSSTAVHTAQTISLLALGTMFWWQVLSPFERNRLSPPAAVLYLGGACMACSLLGIIITLSPVAVCSIYTMPPADHAQMLQTIRTNWGITPQRDQQIGGLLMWVPMCLVYLGAIFAQISRWFAEPVFHTRQQI